MKPEPRPKTEPTPDPQPWPDPDDFPEPDEDPEAQPEDLDDVLASLVPYQLPPGVPPQLHDLINCDAELPIGPGTRFVSLCYRRPKPWWSDGVRGSNFAWPVWTALVHHVCVEIWLLHLVDSLGSDDVEPSVRLVVDFADRKLYLLGAERAAGLLRSQHPPLEDDSSPVNWDDPHVHRTIRAVFEELHERDLLRSRHRRLARAQRGLLTEEERLLLQMTRWLDYRLHELFHEGHIHPRWRPLLELPGDSNTWRTGVNAQSEAPSLPRPNFSRPIGSQPGTPGQHLPAYSPLWNRLSQGEALPCRGCAFFSGNPWFACAVRPDGPKGTDCPDYQAGAGGYRIEANTVLIGRSALIVASGTIGFFVLRIVAFFIVQVVLESFRARSSGVSEEQLQLASQVFLISCGVVGFLGGIYWGLFCFFDGVRVPFRVPVLLKNSMTLTITAFWLFVLFVEATSGHG